MRAGASTVQQTLTPEAAAILKHAVAEACRRGHAQATPLHVAATLLGAPGSPLRRACLQTHPHSSHLPQCRALELCFNIALDRLQAAQGPLPGGQPSYSNALVAALKRAQAHQRRGCPEQQQQPLLAVKVELEQLVISILDDPSVSRVMREAGFSSTDVKNHLEEMVSIMSSHHSATTSSSDQARLTLGAAMDHMGLRLSAAPSFLGNITLPQHLPQYSGLSLERNDTQLRLRPPRAALYMNPRIQSSGGVEPFITGGDDVKHVFEVLMRRKKRNPVLVGDTGQSMEVVIRDLMHRMDRCDVPEQLRGVKFLTQFSSLSLLTATKEEIEMKFIELNKAVDGLMPGGAIIHVGDLQWLLEASQLKGSVTRPLAFCPVQYAAVEMGQILARHIGSGRLWLIGTATSHTYLSCQVQHPTLEGQWELQPVPITTSGLSLSLHSRYKSQSQEAVASAVDASLSLSLHASPIASLKLNLPDEDGAEKLNCCSECMAKYEWELLLLRQQERHAQSESPQSCSSSVETSSKDIDSERSTRPTSAAQPVLPLWLQKAIPANSANKPEAAQVKEKVLPLAQKLRELQKKWNHTCHTLHVHQHFTRSNISSERLQQPSPSSSQVSGGTSARCQERSASLLRDNSSRPVSTRPVTSLFAAVNDNHHPPVRSDLSYGIPGACLPSSNLQNGLGEYHRQINAHKERVQDLTGCCPSNFGLPWQALTTVAPATPTTDAGTPGLAADCEQNGKSAGMFRQMDPDAFKRLCKGLSERVGWQKNVISTIANTVVQCRSGMGKRRGVSLKGDAWLLFLGPDQSGKRKMAEALAELIFGCEKKPICVALGRQRDLSSPSVCWSLGLQELGMPVGSSRGKLPLDRLAEAVRLNPFSVILLEDVDQADPMIKTSLKRAIEKGRLPDSNGREVSCSNVIVVMTSSIGADCLNPCSTEPKTQFTEEGIAVDSGAGLQFIVENTKHEKVLFSTVAVVDNGHAENGGCGAEHQSSAPTCKRKAEWNVEDEPGSRSLETVNKKINAGRALTLDLNMSAEDNEVVDCSGCDTAYKTCQKRGHNDYELIEEQVLHHAREHMKDFCDLVDTAVVFGPSV